MMIVIVSLSIWDFSVLNDKVNRDIELFYQEVKNGCVKYSLEDKVYLSFDYEKVNYYVDEYLDYDTVKIVKENDLQFIIEVYYKNLFFSNVKKEKIYLKRGDLYVDFD